MRKRFLVGAAALAVALVGAGCVDRGAQEQARKTEAFVSDPARDVVAQPASQQTLTQTVEITGQIETSNETQVGSKVAGKVVAVFVKDGDTVSANQLIASLDSTQLMAQVNQALASVSQAQSNLQATRSQLNQAIQNARINPTRSAAAVRQAEAQVRSARAQLQQILKGARTEERAQAEAQVKSAQSALDLAQKELERVQTLVAEGAVPRQRLEQAQNAYNQALQQYNNALQAQLIVQNGARPEQIEVAREAVRQAEQALASARAQQQLDVNLNDQVQGARAQVSAAQAQVQSAQAQVTIAQQALADAQIRAPFAGKVQGNPVQAGTVVAPGTPIATLVGQQGSYFEGEVPETAIVDLTAGSSVAVRVSALPNRTFAGKVAAISPRGASVGRLFTVRVAIIGSTAELKPGMFASGVVTLGTIADAVVVPSKAVVRRGEQSFVYTVEGETAKEVPVRLGYAKGEMVQVFGIAPGTQVVTTGQAALTDGAKIRLATNTTEGGAPQGGA